MSEPKRATLSTISTQKSDVKKVRPVSKTVRFSLTLPESNEKACPEYNYRDLLNSAEKKNRNKEKPSPPVPNGLPLDPFDDDNDDDVKRIAKQFEQKYGAPIKKRKGKKDDYADIGAGYDESDSFIDNTDAYDEMVPEDVTTVLGGFYINSGALEFKQVDLSASEDSSDSDVPNKTVNRKRIIEDSNESESDEDDKPESKVDNPEKKTKLETNGIPKAIKKKLLIPEDKEQPPKKKKLEIDLKKKTITVKDLLREKREDLNMTIEEIDKGQVKVPVVSTSVTDVIESVVNAGRDENVDEVSKDSSSSAGETAMVSAASSDSESSLDGVNPIPVPEPHNEPLKSSEPDLPVVKLPDNLPANILDIINSMKKAAESSEGKVKFFSGSVNTMLLNLEIQCRNLSKSIRLQIYDHLAPFVKCKKDTLMRRAKNLLLEEERSKVKEPLKKLKLAVSNIMPLAIKAYEKECQKVKDEVLSSTDGEINKLKKVPRKKFPWTEEIKKLLLEIINIKKKCFMLEGIRKETFEENLETFLKTVVICIWPEGWMPTHSLLKQCKIILDGGPKPVLPPVQLPAKPMSPITLDVHVNNVNPSAPFTVSPVKNISPSACSTPTPGITVIPIPQPNRTPPLPVAAAVMAPPKPKPPATKPSDLSVVKKPEMPQAPSILNMCAEISAVMPKDTGNSVSSTSTPFPANKHSVTITSVDLRTNNKKDSGEEGTLQNDFPKVPSNPKPTSLKQRILNDIEKPRPSDADECQIIDLTESSATLVRRPGPKSKTKYVDSTGYIKPKSVSQLMDPVHRPKEELPKPEEITGTQALNQIITGLTKYGTNSTEHKPTFKENQSGGVNEADMEQVIKDLQELQQMQEHSRKSEVDLMAPSSSPVSVIAYNSAYSPTKAPPPPAEPPKERKGEGHGFQDVFQKHLYQDITLLKQNQPPSIYNSNVQPKNSLDNFSYSRPGSVPSSVNNLRFNQSSHKYNTQMNHLQSNLPGTTNHTDDFALLSNFLYQYGFHNSSGPKQKSPP